MSSTAPTPSPHRRCECGVAAPRVRVVQERLKQIIPIGQVLEHACPGCKRTFNVHSMTAVIFSAWAATVLTAGGALMTAYPPGAAVGAVTVNRFVGMALLAVGLFSWLGPIHRVYRRVRHPSVPAPAANG